MNKLQHTMFSHTDPTLELLHEHILSAIGRFTRQDRATARLLEQYYGQTSFAS